MQQISLPQPNDNVQEYKNLLYSVSSADGKISEISTNTPFHPNISDQTNPFLKQDFNWEYFSNELEFE